jgi:crotonobetainyl-CoA:carnitine CoA-transferase CaiB-like acyl-CoA transferase
VTALQGLRVLDLSRLLPGPFCTQLLADLGADVIKIEDPAGGDPARYAPPRIQGVGAIFLQVNRNKRSLALNLKAPEGRDLLLRLAERADVLVESFRPGVMDRLGVGYQVLRERNPRLVYASLSGFGQTGPYAERPGLDQVAQGMGGLMSVTGPPGSGPWRVGIAISDTAAGTFLTQGVLAALFARERTGRGQWVSTSLLEAMVNFMDFQACRWLTDDVVPAQEGNDHPTIFPMGAYRCADGWINVAGAMKLDRFLDVIGAMDLLDDPRFADADARRANRVAFNESCEARLLTDTATNWTERLNAAGIPAGPVYAVDEVFADPQVVALDMRKDLPHRTRGSVSVVGNPVRLSATPPRVETAAPDLGAHNDVFLRE